MTGAVRYRTLAQPVEAEIKEKGSRFIAYAYPAAGVDEVKQYVADRREVHHKARHWCYAYRLGGDGNQFRAYDDGEPAGSAGRPILGQIDSFGLSDTLVVVVRYFGGTLLGVPGLIRAYKGSAAAALQQAQIVEKNIEKTLYLRCAYADLNDVIRVVRRYRAQVVAQDWQLACCLTVRVPLDDYAVAVQAWQQMHCLEVGHEPFV